MYLYTITTWCYECSMQMEKIGEDVDDGIQAWVMRCPRCDKCIEIQIAEEIK